MDEVEGPRGCEEVLTRVVEAAPVAMVRHRRHLERGQAEPAGGVGWQ